MKKALSVCLIAALIVSVAAPLALAAKPDTGYNKGQETLPEMTIGDEATLTPTHACTAKPKDPRRDEGEFLLFWDVEAEMSGFRVNFRPEKPVDDNLLKGIFDASSSSLGNDGMVIEAIYAGDVTIWWECQDCGDSYAYKLTIKVPEPEPIDDNDNFLGILRIWWTDLKSTWDYNIHPFLKYVYYSLGDWIKSACNIICEGIKGLFNGSGGGDDVVEETTTAVIETTTAVVVPEPTP